MPPTYKAINNTTLLDNSIEHHLFDFDYYPDAFPEHRCKTLFDYIISKNLLSQHTYHGNFSRVITPKRLTASYVPERNFYRYKGKDLKNTNRLKKLYKYLKERLPYDFNSMVVNGYRYNKEDYISPHIDNEKFLIGKVITLTILKSEKEMEYRFSNKDGNYSIFAKNGSIIVQGFIEHEVPPVKEYISEDVGRISITMRTLVDRCEHQTCDKKCQKISCPYNYGPSNYLYYNNSDCL